LTLRDTLLEKNMINQPSQSELGKDTSYDQTYNPGRLFPIPRSVKRQEIGVDPVKLPFQGVDLWNHYEVSWLNPKGKPMVAVAEIILPCESPNIIESKSMKLYFNSLNHSKFESMETLQKIISQDLSKTAGALVHVQLKKLSDEQVSGALKGENIDDLDVDCSLYTVNPGFLKTSQKQVEETLCSDLLKSNCLVTNQPDWGSIQIHYKGPKIDREGLLKYLVSFRNHNEFHEQCIERIFVDILKFCKPQELTVYGRYTRRGGLDINPCRSTKLLDANGLNARLVRQ
jgi:7-cyano-7-deazaguanine reductase